MTAQNDLRMAGEVVVALLTRLGGQVVITADDLFVARQSAVIVQPIDGGGLAMQLVLPDEIPHGAKVFLG